MKLCFDLSNAPTDCFKNGSVAWHNLSPLGFLYYYLQLRLSVHLGERYNAELQKMSFLWFLLNRQLKAPGVELTEELKEFTTILPHLRVEFWLHTDSDGRPGFWVPALLNDQWLLSLYANKSHYKVTYGMWSFASFPGTSLLDNSRKDGSYRHVCNTLRFWTLVSRFASENNHRKEILQRWNDLGWKFLRLEMSRRPCSNTTSDGAFIVGLPTVYKGPFSPCVRRNAVQFLVAATFSRVLEISK